MTTPEKLTRERLIQWREEAISTEPDEAEFEALCDLALAGLDAEKMTKERDALLRYAKAAANPNRDYNSICPRPVIDISWAAWAAARAAAWAEFSAAEAALRELGVKL